jgi:hypothetical protein
VAVLVVLAVIVGASALLADVLYAVLVSLGALSAAGVTVLVVILRRTGAGVAVKAPPAPRRAAVPPVAYRPPVALSAPRPRLVMPGEVMAEDTSRDQH